MTMVNKHSGIFDDTSKKLFELYSDVNPSTVDPSREIELARRYAVQLTKSFGLPRLVFESRSLLDVGCGSGANLCAYAFLGANVTGVDFDKKAISNAVSFMDRQGLTAEKLLVGSIYDLTDCALENFYDIVTCSGLLHHLSDPYQGFRNLIEKVRPGGLLIVRVGNQIAAVQHQLMKLAVRFFVEDINDIKKTTLVTEALFAESLHRAATFGGRSIKQIVTDQIVNNQHYYVLAEDLVRVGQDKGVYLLDQFPRASGFFGDSAINNSISPGDVSSENHIVSQLYSASHVRPDAEVFQNNEAITGAYEAIRRVSNIFNGPTDMFFKKGDKSLDEALYHIEQRKDHINNLDFDTVSVQSNISKFFNEMHDFFMVLREKNIEDMVRFTTSTDVLFRGTCGLHLNTYLFEKSVDFKTEQS